MHLFRTVLIGILAVQTKVWQATTSPAMTVPWAIHPSQVLVPLRPPLSVSSTYASYCRNRLHSLTLLELEPSAFRQACADRGRPIPSTSFRSHKRDLITTAFVPPFPTNRDGMSSTTTSNIPSLKATAELKSVRPALGRTTSVFMQTTARAQEQTASNTTNPSTKFNNETLSSHAHVWHAHPCELSYAPTSLIVEILGVEARPQVRVSYALYAVTDLVQDVLSVRFIVTKDWCFQ